MLSKLKTMDFTLHDVTKIEELYYNTDPFFSQVDPYILFSLANRVFPSSRSITGLRPGVKIIDRFRQQFQVSEENCFHTEHAVSSGGPYRYSHAMFMVRRNLMVRFSIEHMSPSALVLFSYQTDPGLLEEVCQMLQSEVKKADHPHIGLLTYNPAIGTQLTNFDIDASGIDIEECFNDDLKPVHQTILSKLNTSKEKGVVLLHGIPGTGKTTYIRYLTSLLKKQMIFVPHEVAMHITSPDFLSFMLGYKESVLILEDAENLLKTRDEGENLSVASLLNLSDGLLSDCLHMQLICTFNTDITRLDKALLRKGRIIARYEFKPLTIQKSSLLTSRMYKVSKIDHPMTLAEIYNMPEDDYSVQRNRKIGFT